MPDAAGTQHVTVRVPAALRALSRQRPRLELDVVRDGTAGVTVREVFAALRDDYPGIHDAALDECGEIRTHVNLFVGIENVRFGSGLDTQMPAEEALSILAAVSGG